MKQYRDTPARQRMAGKFTARLQNIQNQQFLVDFTSVQGTVQGL